MKYFIMRCLYRFIYWFASMAHGSDIHYGFYKKFKKPSEVRNEDLDFEFKRLAYAIRDSSEMG